MTVHFMCPCGAGTYHLPDTMVGKNVKCPKCGELIVVPQAQGGKDVVMATPAEKPPNP